MPYLSCVMGKLVKLLPYFIILVCLILSAAYYHRFIPNLAFGDLHIKIQGAKDMSENNSAYFYRNKRVDTLAPGVQPAVTGLTSTPIITWLHLPFINMTKCDAKKAYFWVNYAMYLFSFLLVLYLTKNIVKRYILAAVLVLFFLVSRYFFYHIDGQVYVLYALQFLVLIALLNKKQYFLFGLVFAIAIASRPVFILAVPLLLLYYNRHVIIGLMAGGVLLAIFTLITHTLSYWQEYNQSMKLYTYENPNYFNKHYHYTLQNTPFTKIIAITTKGDCYTPINRDSIFKIPGGMRKPGLLYPIQSYFLNNKIIITNNWFYTGLTLFAVAIITFFIRRKYNSLLPQQLMAATFVFYIIAEVCIPAPRGDYNFVIWMFGAFVVLAYGNRLAMALMLLGLLFNHTTASTFWLGQYGEGMMLIACLLVIFNPPRNNKNEIATSPDLITQQQ